jgi:hypothetical protein|tara:strand:+ start:383 stop:559 length:177 start_codon:yes stop_codon:yes gene_type:complete
MKLIEFIIVDSLGNEHKILAHENRIDNGYVVIWHDDFEHEVIFYKPISVTFSNVDDKL